MFDIGFWEMLLLMALGLVILGPDKLPVLAIKIGNYVGKARSMVNSFARQMRQEVELKPNRPMTPEPKNNSPTSQEDLPLSDLKNNEVD